MAINDTKNALCTISVMKVIVENVKFLNNSGPCKSRDLKEKKLRKILISTPFCFQIDFYLCSFSFYLKKNQCFK